MSREILHGLFNGKIIPWERHNPNSKRQNEILQKLDSEQQYFISKMSLDDAARFKEFADLHMELSSIEEDDIFAYSFTLGMLLMMDVMKEATTLCEN